MTTNFSDFVIKLALILLLSILPSLVYLLIFRRAKERWQTRLRRAQIINNYYQEQYSRNTGDINRDRFDLYHSGRDRRRPVTKYFIGDTSCINNAQSPYIRCAINPEGPCDECSHYEKRYKHH